jgi:hypothetical protein
MTGIAASDGPDRLSRSPATSRQANKTLENVPRDVMFHDGQNGRGQNGAWHLYDRGCLEIPENVSPTQRGHKGATCRYDRAETRYVRGTGGCAGTSHGRPIESTHP